MQKGGEGTRWSGLSLRHVGVLQPDLLLLALVMYCTDPGEVEHSTRLISDPVLLVGTTIQYTCNLGFVLEGSSLLTCYSRETGTPIWTSRLPRCVRKSGARLGMALLFLCLPLGTCSLVCGHARRSWGWW